MQQKIQQALANSPLSNAILYALEEQEWKGFLPAEKVRSICETSPFVYKKHREAVIK